MHTDTSQVGRRELKKLKEEDLAEIMEAEKLAKKGIMSIISTHTRMHVAINSGIIMSVFIIDSERKVESGICEVDGLGATDRYT